MRPSGLILICLAVLCLPALAWSKGAVVRIEIGGDGIPAPIVITDPEIVGQFSIWNGPGVSTSGPDGIPHPPAYLDPSATSGRFIFHVSERWDELMIPAILQATGPTAESSRQ